MEYFSDQEHGSKARTEDVILPSVWGGIVAAVKGLISTGAFGEHFPEVCLDGTLPVGTDESAFSLAIQAEIPELEWPLKTTQRQQEGYRWEEIPYSPSELVVLDFVQFCYLHVSKPIQGTYHEWHKHYHLSFDSQTGKDEFRQKINRIFSRNGVSYELKQDGNIIRLAPAVLREELESANFSTGDGTLNQMLEEARRKFLDPNPTIRREAVERLWDSWERLKSIEVPLDKKDSISQLLDKAAAEEKFRGLLEEEARKLSDIGNTFHIRHSEVTQTAINEPLHIDYLFHRLFSMILLLIRARNI
ncbi:AbiJ-NTD4 domain-containing protein [Candidatus Nitronereus thalassa]|uniref:HEPN AbiJ-N-terminal domain-containing protein n=1 Tax=Candidatus Nitronereus thalassa TaxID=3020898 RepID=A0ABU3K933_9BACT|nr:hypothetical protein [Candidatus Nitronereus thalassa]MDT7042877.1 hypothetical protein [Candidatus Nitronereus thalassa]